MPIHAMASSAMIAIGYDDAQRWLQVEFSDHSITHTSIFLNLSTWNCCTRRRQERTSTPKSAASTDTRDGSSQRYSETSLS
jgi:hypothetical protein